MKSVCGIVGFTTKTWSPGPARIDQATATLFHRGPDQQGVFRSARCSLGATRLKIIDLAAGDQPILAEDGEAAIVFNGEIYNHLEVRAALELRGHRFRTHCDTETVLHAFLEWDTDCFERLRGMFAVAIWCGADRRLVLARDRVGIKPLYIASRGEDLFFASELKGILVHPEIERPLSASGLDCFLSMNYVPAPWTLIDGIDKVPPGHWLEWRDGRIRSEAYWRIPEMTPAAISLEDAKAQLDLLLRESVRDHMMSDVPLGIWLSGGIDSTTILHYACEASSARLRTYSISFAGRSFDEAGPIGEAVRRYGTEHEQLDLNPEQDLEGAIRELSYYSDEPSADSGALPVWFLSRLCKQTCTVAFSGEGADEIFGGYLTYRANRIARQLRKVPAPLLGFALRGVNAWPVSNDKISFEYKVKRLLQGTLLPPEEAHIYWNGTFSETEKAALVKEPLPGSFSDVLSTLRSALPGDGVAPYLTFDQRYYLADDILVKSDRISMAHAVEVRPPFLDHRILEFAAGIPTEMKIRGSVQKYVLKELMKSKLKVPIAQRRKVGFDIPTHDWFRGPLRGLLLETLESAQAEYAEVFDFDAIQELTRLHISSAINVGYHLWGLMTLFLWMKRWSVQPAPVRRMGEETLAIGR